MNTVIFISALLALGQVDALCRGPSTCEERETAGLICTSCQELSTCVNIGGSWLTVPVDTCTDNTLCNVQQGECSAELGPCHSQDSITCTGQGFFPDVFDCQKYYFCASASVSSVLFQCDSHFAFNVADSVCSLPYTDPVCQSLVITCTEVGQTGPWPRNANIFYVCTHDTIGLNKHLIPHLYRCPANLIYDAAMGCIQPTTSSSTTTGTTTTKASTT